MRFATAAHFLLAMIFMAGFAPAATARASGLSPALEAALDQLPAGEEARVIVHLSDMATYADTLWPQGPPGKKEAAEAIKAANKAGLTWFQALASALGASEIRPLWLLDAVALAAPPDLLRQLANLSEVAVIIPDQTFAIFPEPADQAPQAAFLARSAAPAEWNVEKVGAPMMWGLGYDATGTVVGVMDTGADLNHPDLAATYRGGANSWYDPNGEHAEPYDASGHGTQVTSLVTGGSAGGTAIGVAPGARWIAAKIFADNGQTSVSTIIEAYGWMLDPDSDPATDDAPDVVNSSWGFDAAPGECLVDLSAIHRIFLDTGINVVYAAGNSGPGMDSSVSPANNVDSFAVGATDQNDLITSRSSRGPGACDGRIFPDITAPGFQVRAAGLAGGYPLTYVLVSGTSFSAPAASGALLLLRQAFPKLAAEKLAGALMDGAFDLGEEGPDNVYGHGRLDLAGAYESVIVENGYCLGDVNGDSRVNGLDVDILEQEYGRLDCLESGCFADLNFDGSVNLADLVFIRKDYGRLNCPRR